VDETALIWLERLVAGHPDADLEWLRIGEVAGIPGE
jgi:hypothetical protein